MLTACSRINTSTEFHLARTAWIEIRISENQFKSAEQLEKHTKSLLLLMQSLLDETKGLRHLTVGLLILTAGLLVITHNALLYTISCRIHMMYHHELCGK